MNQQQCGKKGYKRFKTYTLYPAKPKSEILDGEKIHTKIHTLFNTHVCFVRTLATFA